MQFQGILITMIVFFCIHDCIQAKPTKINIIYPRKTISNIETTSSPKVCRDSSNCPEHSQCVGGICECVMGYTQFEDGELCAYRQKSKLVAFMLSFFFGVFGVDWFYLSRGNAGYIVAGIFKILPWFGCLYRFYTSENVKLVLYYTIVGAILTIISLIWWLVDWIRILADAFPDGNGVALYSM